MGFRRLSSLLVVPIALAFASGGAAASASGGEADDERLRPERAPFPAPPAGATVAVGGEACESGALGFVRAQNDAGQLRSVQVPSGPACDAARAAAGVDAAGPAVRTYDGARAAAASVRAPAPPPAPPVETEAVTLDLRVEPIALPDLQPPEVALPSGPELFAPPPAAPAETAPPSVDAAATTGPAAGEPARVTHPTTSPAAIARQDEAAPSERAMRAPPTEAGVLTAFERAKLAPRTLGDALASHPLTRHVLASAAVGILAWLAAGMYHRLQPSETLDHPARQQILTAVQRAGRLRLAEISRATRIHPKTARYHAEALVAARLLARDPAGGYRPPGVPGAVPLDVRIVETVRETPGIHIAEVARRLAVSKACAQGHVARLLAAGSLASRPAAGARRLFPA